MSSSPACGHAFVTAGHHARRATSALWPSTRLRATTRRLSRAAHPATPNPPNTTLPPRTHQFRCRASPPPSWESSCGSRSTVGPPTRNCLHPQTKHAQTSSRTADATRSSSATRTSPPSSVPMARASRTAWTPSPSSWESGRPICDPRS